MTARPGRQYVQHPVGQKTSIPFLRSRGSYKRDAVYSRHSLTGRLVVLLRENKLAIAIEILVMLAALYGIEYYSAELIFTMVV